MELIHRVANQPKVIPGRFRSKSQPKVKARKKASHSGFRERLTDETRDGRYLEVIEEMLRRRENNGRDRDEPTGALKDDD